MLFLLYQLGCTKYEVWMMSGALISSVHYFIETRYWHTLNILGFHGQFVIQAHPAPKISFWVNWVFTQPGYPQLHTCKNNCVFSYFFTPRFFFCNNTFSYCMKPSGMCLHIYSFPLSAFLKYQTRWFYCTLLTFERLNFAKFHFQLSVFPRNTGLGTDIFIKLEYIARSLVKNKINTRLAFVY